MPPAADRDCCATIARSVQGACALACDDPSLAVPKVDDEDPACDAFLSDPAR